MNCTCNEVDNIGYSIGHFKTLHGKLHFNDVKGCKLSEGILNFVLSSKEKWN